MISQKGHLQTVKYRCLFASVVSCHNPPVPGLLDHALPVMNLSNRSQHKNQWNTGA